MPIEELCKSQTLHTTLEDYQLAVEAGSRNREAAFELAIKSATPFSVGDPVSYYITLARVPPMVAPVLRLTGTRSRAMKMLTTTLGNSKTWPNSLTSSLPALAPGQTFLTRKI